MITEKVKIYFIIITKYKKNDVFWQIFNEKIVLFFFNEKEKQVEYGFLINIYFVIKLQKVLY